MLGERALIWQNVFGKTCGRKQGVEMARHAEAEAGEITGSLSGFRAISARWTALDQSFFFGILILLGIGAVLSLAAGPAVAARIGFESYHFTTRHFAAIIIAAGIFGATAFLTPRQLRRTSLVVFALALIAILGVLIWGGEVKGARRWLQLGGFSLQPSEFAKPAFLVLNAWLFAEYQKRADVPALPIAIALLVVFAGALLLQPDFGQALLAALIWSGLFFLAGMPVLWVFVLGFASLGTGCLAYQTMPHVRFRIDSFFDPSVGDGYQIGRALKSFEEGGWLGVGPGEGRIKLQLPDAHSDFVFSVLAEEYGLLVCLAVAGLYAFLVLRGLSHALAARDGFARLAIAGLILMFGGQALINMAVNTGLLPAKGMTLPFISYGGSSMAAMAFAMGAVLALARDNSAGIKRAE